MSLGTLATPSASSIAHRRGYVRVLKTRKPVSTGCVTPSSVTSTVWLWPPTSPRFEERHVDALPLQQPRRAQAGDAAPHDRDPHVPSPGCRKRTRGRQPGGRVTARRPRCAGAARSRAARPCVQLRGRVGDGFSARLEQSPQPRAWTDVRSGLAWTLGEQALDQGDEVAVVGLDLAREARDRLAVAVDRRTCGSSTAATCPCARRDR